MATRASTAWRHRQRVVASHQARGTESASRIAVVTAAVTTLVGIVTALALVRFDFRGKGALGTLVILPALVPETILGVGLLILIKSIDQPRSLPILVLGHILLALPYVVLIAQARMVGVKRVYEEAALSLGASRLASFREITLPLLIPAVVAGALLSFTISFDNTSASLFWRPAGVETMPTQILSMLKTSISPEVNALGTVMIVMTVGIPLIGGILIQIFTRRTRRYKTRETA